MNENAPAFERGAVPSGPIEIADRRGEARHPPAPFVFAPALLHFAFDEQQGRPVGARLGQGRVERERPVVGRERFGVFALFVGDQAEGAQRAGVIGTKGERALCRGAGGRLIAGAAQGGAKIGVSLGVGRPDGDGLAVGRDCVLNLAEAGPRVATIVVGLGQRRIAGDGAGERGRGLARPAKAEQRQPLRIVIGGIGRVERQRAADQSQRFAVIATLMMDEAKQMQRVGVFGVLEEEAAVECYGLGEPAGPVRGHGLGEERRGQVESVHRLRLRLHRRGHALGLILSWHMSSLCNTRYTRSVPSSPM